MLLTKALTSNLHKPFCGVLSLLLSAGILAAQGIGLIERSTGPSMITTTSGEREILIEVQVWGQVMRPGMYKVPVSTDAVGLISYAGGPSENAALSRVKLVRNGFPKGKTIKLDLDRYTGSGDRGPVPMLETGDVVIVPVTCSHRFSTFTGFISQLAVIVTAYLVIADKR